MSGRQLWKNRISERRAGGGGGGGSSRLGVLHIRTFVWTRGWTLGRAGSQGQAQNISTNRLTRIQSSYFTCFDIDTTLARSVGDHITLLDYLYAFDLTYFDRRNCTQTRQLKLCSSQQLPQYA